MFCNWFSATNNISIFILKYNIRLLILIINNAEKYSSQHFNQMLTQPHMPYQMTQRRYGYRSNIVAKV